MFPRDFYEIVHIIGIAIVFLSLGGIAVNVASGAVKMTPDTRKLVSTMHGVGIFFILIGGFGMLARMGFQHGANFPGWLWVKIIAWLILGGSSLLLYRRPSLARPALLLLPLLAGLAVYMALYKPF